MNELSSLGLILLLALLALGLARSAYGKRAYIEPDTEPDTESDTVTATLSPSRSPRSSAAGQAQKSCFSRFSPRQIDRAFLLPSRLQILQLWVPSLRYLRRQLRPPPGYQ